MLPTIATGNVGSALAGGYEVANSLRFDDGSSDHLFFGSTGTDGNRKSWTLSLWFKRANLGSTQTLFSSGKSHILEGFVRINSSDRLEFKNDGQYGGEASPTRVLRDTSAWYHLVWSVDSTQASNDDRWKIYLNGELISASEYSSVAITSNGDGNILTFSGTYASDLAIGRRERTDADYWDGYIAEAVLVEGSQLDPTSFGEFDEDTGIWKPIDVSGLTFGTNGFYLDFENSGSLGADASGNANNFTVNNLTSIDQSTDTCTNNFATMNPLDNYYQSATFSEGNLKIVTAGSTYTYNSSTFALSSGKWYCEIKVVSTDTNGRIGVAGILSTASTNEFGNGIYHWGYVSGTGQIENNNTHTSYGSSYTNGDIIGIYLDLDNNKLYFAKNGTIQNSGTGINITDPTNVTDGVYYIGVGETSGANSLTAEINFGNPIFSISSGNADANGYGNFEYSPNDGGSASFDSTAKDFYALNTKNLAEFG